MYKYEIKSFFFFLGLGAGKSYLSNYHCLACVYVWIQYKYLFCQYTVLAVLFWRFPFEMHSKFRYDKHMALPRIMYSLNDDDRVPRIFVASTASVIVCGIYSYANSSHLYFQQ